ncbi:Hypothetical predicted protein [Pelobates cultripes]|uniref:Uncharacterized protein n=1 Tax=Pelobates cultripes TaxID=61616 RepID=A0AAD1RBH8_PELCU|nr:Hypothetical predicted protein [Pelobates cultripes]
MENKAAACPTSSGREAHTRASTPNHLSSQTALRTQRSSGTEAHRSSGARSSHNQWNKATLPQSDPTLIGIKQRNTGLKPQAAWRRAKRRPCTDTQHGRPASCTSRSAHGPQLPMETPSFTKRFDG